MAKKRGMSFVDVPLVAMKFKSFSHFTFVCFVVLTLKDAGGHIVYIFFAYIHSVLKTFFQGSLQDKKIIFHKWAILQENFVNIF